MKTAVYLEDGITQIVLTPETQWEKFALQNIPDGKSMDILHGAFYHCSGGWDRQGDINTDERSLILRLDKSHV